MVKLQQAKDSCTGVGSNSNFESPPHQENHREHRATFLFYASSLLALTSCQLSISSFPFLSVLFPVAAIYRVFQKTDTQFYFWDNFGNSAPILTTLSLLQAEIYGV